MTGRDERECAVHCANREGREGHTGPVPLLCGFVLWGVCIFVLTPFTLFVNGVNIGLKMLYSHLYTEDVTKIKIYIYIFFANCNKNYIYISPYELTIKTV